MWNTELTKLLNIEYPIIQGGMAHISDAKLAAAVRSAGGAGVMASGGFFVDEVRKNIKLYKDIMGKNQCFGVNIMIKAPNKDDILQLVCDEKVPFVTLAAGDASPYFSTLQTNGIKCIPLTTTLKSAIYMQEKGADALILEGMESGGHDGKITIMSLMQNIVPSIKIPIIAAGGIVDGKGIAAALILGASGVQIGTRFLISEECAIHENAKNAIINATDTDSTVTGFSTTASVRGLKNKFSENYISKEYNGASQSELDSLATGTLEKGMLQGDIENGYVLAGMSLVQLNKILPAKEIVKELIYETELALNKAPNLI